MQEYNDSIELLKVLINSGKDEVQPIIPEKEEPLTSQERLDRWVRSMDL